MGTQRAFAGSLGSDSPATRRALTNRGERANQLLVLRLLMVLSPAETAHVGRLVILALDHVLRAAVIEAEDRVIHVFSDSLRRESLPR